MMERTKKDGEDFHRLVWHDRKAWWQQEQGILAYYIMAGVYNDKPEYLRYAREGSAFYNGWFLDYEEGGIYFNVLANGQPYALGTERGKGSHSMAGYHSFELCFLAAIYTNLLVNRQPMDFYFSPNPGVWPDNILRVAPDLLPNGSIELTEVWIDDKIYENFDRQKLCVNLPDSTKPLKVRCRITPAGMGFDANLLTYENGIATFSLNGELNTSSLRYLKQQVEKLQGLKGLVLDLTHLNFISNTGWNYLLFTKQRAGSQFQLSLRNPSADVRQSLEDAELAEEFPVI
jgi:anti-anti-sigma regulatory factor